MSRIKTIETKDIAKTVQNGGCGSSVLRVSLP